MHFLMDFIYLFFSKILVFLKKITFHTFEKIFQRYILIPKFKELHFCFTDPFLFQKFCRCTLTSAFFFSWKKNNFAFQKALAEFFLVRPWPFLQPPEANLLISVCYKRSKSKIYLFMQVFIWAIVCWTGLRFDKFLNALLCTAAHWS